LIFWVFRKHAPIKGTYQKRNKENSRLKNHNQELLTQIKEYQSNMQMHEFVLQIKKLEDELSRQQQKYKDLEDMFGKELLEKDNRNFLPKGS
jgi:predicted nuclease with TOPRIM domain